MESFLLNVMGSAATAFAVIVGIMTARLSREMARAPDNPRKPTKPTRRAID